MYLFFCTVHPPILLASSSPYLHFHFVPVVAIRSASLHRSLAIRKTYSHAVLHIALRSSPKSRRAPNASPDSPQKKKQTNEFGHIHR